MEVILYFLLLAIGLSVAAAVNYRRSALKNKESLRLQQEATQTLSSAKQEYCAAMAARLAAEQAKDEANRTLQNVQQYWATTRLN